MKLISVVIPIYNEASNIKNLYSELCSVLAPFRETYNFELVFVDDGSTDGSGDVIRSLGKGVIRIRTIEFTRNFSKEIALSAGLNVAEGTAVILMDADLQHPPKIIPEFISRWERGAEVVVGVRCHEGREGKARSFFSGMFNVSMTRLSQLHFSVGETDFRLLDRRVVNEFCRFTEHRRITRGLVNWLGFKQQYVEFLAPDRRGGISTYTTAKLIKLALNAFFSHSLLPLRVAGYLGCAITFLSGLLGFLIFVDMFILHDPIGAKITGTAMLAVLILFLIGIVLICLGIISYYIRTIQDEVFGRPLYVVRKIVEN